MYEDWPFFAATIDLIEMILAKVRVLPALYHSGQARAFVRVCGIWNLLASNCASACSSCRPEFAPEKQGGPGAGCTPWSRHTAKYARCNVLSTHLQCISPLHISFRTGNERSKAAAEPVAALAACVMTRDPRIAQYEAFILQTPIPSHDMRGATGGVTPVLLLHRRRCCWRTQLCVISLNCL